MADGRMYCFGPFRYDAEQRLLFRDGEVVAAPPKAIDTLHVLLERRGRVVEKGELMKLVWPDTVVEDVGLARNISLLRKALGEEGEGQFIETVPRRGYRFAAEVAGDGRTRRRRWPWIAAAGGVLLGVLIYWQFYTPSRFLGGGEGLAGLAVVPFECLSAEAETAQFARGVDALVVAELARIGGLQVVSPSTVRRHQRVGMSMGLMGRLLGLEVLVEGTVQKVGDRIRVTARVVDVHTGKLVWADNYESPAAEAGQLEVARTVAGEVGRRLTAREGFGKEKRKL